MNTPHISVMKEEVLRIFESQKINLYIDGTVGAGGHAAAVLSAHPEITKCIAVDQDPEALILARKALKSWEDKVFFWKDNFHNVMTQVNEDGMKADAILLDLGVSSMQFDRAEKGFSFTYDGPLDMRMNPDAELTAEEIVNTWEEASLGKIFRDYGEEKQWRAAARAIVRARSEAPIKTTRQLVDALSPVIYRKKGKLINPLTLVFQALRICVNSELDVLEKTLPLCIDVLKPGGCLAVITFHSLEDRIVKNLFRFYASDKENTSGLGGLFIDKEPEVKILTRKPMIATDAEVESNPRSRSAKLRAIEKL